MCVVLYAATKTFRKGLLLYQKENDAMNGLAVTSVILNPAHADEADEAGQEAGICCIRSDRHYKIRNFKHILLSCFKKKL